MLIPEAPGSESVNRKMTDNTMAKKNGPKDTQLFRKHTHNTKDRVTRTPLRTGGTVFIMSDVY
jgi:hypothetical protein